MPAPHQRKRDTAPAGVPQAAWERLTAFQQRVYRATALIPRGETRSYQWVAREIGAPQAMRAVGQALRANPFMPAVPCHRVIRADGALGGYAGGSAKKRRLLRAEGRNIA